MVLLRRRNWIVTLVAVCATLSAYALVVFWARPGFMEKHYYEKQRLWAKFLSSCACEHDACPDSFNLNMMYGHLYDQLILDSEHGNRSVVKYLVWQPHKIAVAYPLRLRMYAHMALILPRSLAVLHSLWLGSGEDLAKILQHLSQGVPQVLDVDSLPGQRVEPDATMLCKLEPAKRQGGQVEGELRNPGTFSNSTSSTSAVPDDEWATATQPQQRHEGSAAEDGDKAVDGPASGGGGGGGAAGDKNHSNTTPLRPDEEAHVRQFVCTLYAIRGAAPLLRLLRNPASVPAATQRPPSGPQHGSSTGESLTDQPSTPPLPATPPEGLGRQADLDSSIRTGGSSSGSTLGNGAEEVCSGAAVGEEGVASGGDGSCSPQLEDSGEAPPGSEAASEQEDKAMETEDKLSTSASSGRSVLVPGAHGDSTDDDGAQSSAASGLDRGSGGPPGRRGNDGFCRNSIFIRPPRQSEVLEHVREVETSPLGLGPGDFLRAAVPRIGELLGWLLLPHVMMGRYVLLLAPPLPQPPVEDMPGYDGEGYGIELYKDWLPMLSVGLQLMLLSGALLTVCEMLLAVRLAGELMSLRRPGRSWARRRAVAWRVFFEGMLQPLRESLLSWNFTHLMALPLVHLVMSMTTVDLAMLVPLAYCVVLLGAASLDVAARATPALLRIARRARRHDNAYGLTIVNILLALAPKELPYIVQFIYWFNMYDTLGINSRAAVVAAMLLEVPGLAGQLLAERAPDRRAAGNAAGGGGGRDGGGGQENAALAAAMLAHVVGEDDGDGAVRNHQGPGRGGEGRPGGDLYDSEDEDELDEGGPQDRKHVVLRWPVPLQLPLEVHEWEDVPRGFTCAITQNVMTQPAMLVSPDLSAAPTYERSAIQQWLAGQMRDPKSNTPLNSYSLLPNESLYRSIDDWVTHRLREAQQHGQQRGRIRRRRARFAVGVEEGALGAGADEAGRCAIASMSCSVIESESRTRSGSLDSRPAQSGSVLASIAQGASCLVETGVEVISRAAAGVAAAAAVATAAAGGGPRVQQQQEQLQRGADVATDVSDALPPIGSGRLRREAVE